MLAPKYHFYEIQVKSAEVDAVSDLIWSELQGVLGVEETNESKEAFQKIDKDFDIIEFGTEAARKSAEYLAQSHFRKSETVYLRVYLDVLSDIQADENHKKLESWRSSNILLGVESRSELKTDYQEEYKKHFRGIQLAKNLWVGPPWDPEIPIVDYKIFIEPGMAFGTGDHPTTQMCVERLYELKNLGLSPKTILDLGTGTGVLALACRKFFPQAKIVALDLDPQCEENFLKNFALNSEDPSSVEFHFGESAGDIKNLAGDFELVVSNIYAEVLAFLFSHIQRVLAPGGTWVTSGILEGESEKKLLDKVETHLALIERRSRSKDQDFWVMIEFRDC